MADDLDRVLIHLAVEGALSLEDRQLFPRMRLLTVFPRRSVSCALMTGACSRAPHPKTLIRLIAVVLCAQPRMNFKRLTEEGGDAERDIAAEALQRLYIEHMKLQAGQR